MTLTRLAAPLFVLLAACSGEHSSDPAPAADTSSDLRASSCRGLLGTDASHYATSAPNVARELAAAVGPSFVTGGVTSISGVLRASSSTSPYTYAATLELGSWSMVGTTTFDGASGSELFVRIENAPAHTLFDAMTSATQT